MVQVINDEFSGNVFGRLGKGIGKGLSEQIPKEIERTRLASGLEKLGNEAQGLTPLQVFTRAAGIPGITPQHLYTMAPIINQQIQKQNFLNRGQPSGGAAAGAASASENISQGQPTTKMGTTTPGTVSGSFASPSEISNYKQNIMQEPSFDQITNLAKDYLNQGIVQDPQEATALAKQELNQNRLAQQQKNQAFRTHLTDRLSRDLQGGGLNDFKDISGQIQNSLLDQGEYMINQQGMTPEAASAALSDIATDLGKTSNKLKDTGSFANMFRSKKTKITELKEQKRNFEKYGFGEQFDDMAAAELGITPLEAAHVLSPLKNKEIENTIEKTKKLSQKSPENNIDQATLDKIIKSITPKDNLFSIEYKLRDKGLDIQQFKSRLQELVDAEEVALTPQQKRQQERPVSMSFLGDLLFEAL